MLYVVVMGLLWLLPIVLCWMIVFDADPPRRVKGRGIDPRVLTVPVLGLALTAVLWHAAAGSFGPTRR